MLYKWALNMAHSFYKNSGKPYDADDAEDYAYGLEMLIENIFELLAVLICGIILNRAFETLAFIASFTTLRGMAGGYHAKTSLRCFLTFVTIYAVFLGVIHLTPLWAMMYMALVCTLLSGVVVLCLAPVAHPNRPMGPLERKGFRNKSVVVYLVGAVIIAGLCGFGIAVTSPETVTGVTLSLALGQLTSAGSLVAAKIQYAE